MGTFARLLIALIIVLVLTAIGIQLFYKGGLSQAWKDISKKPNVRPQPKPSPSPTPSPTPSPVVPQDQVPVPTPVVPLPQPEEPSVFPEENSGQELAPTPIPHFEIADLVPNPFGPKPPKLVPDGCTMCSPGVVYCPNAVLPDNLKQPAPLLGMLMSTYRLPGDPESPPITLGKFQYYYRQGSLGC